MCSYPSQTKVYSNRNGQRLCRNHQSKSEVSYRVYAGTTNEDIGGKKMTEDIKRQEKLKRIQEMLMNEYGAVAGIVIFKASNSETVDNVIFIQNGQPIFILYDMYLGNAQKLKELIDAVIMENTNNAQKPE